MSKTRCIIFGGGGFIGCHLTEKLTKKNYPVTVFARGSKWDYKNLSSINKKINFIRGDFSNINLISKIVRPDDVVFDLIASSVPFSSMQSPLEEIKHHILTHVQFIELACIKRVREIVFASSGGGIYGKKPKYPISEKETPQPTSPHAISKITIEYFLEYFSRIYNTPYLIYRISNPYGPRQIPKKGFGVVPTLFSHILQNKPPILFDNGKLIRDFIYIDDVINAIVRSFHKRTKYHVYNIGSGKGVSLKTLWQEIKKITKTELQPILKPKRPIDVDTVTLNIDRFKKEFNWEPKTELSLGLEKTWRAYRNQ